MPRKRAKVEKEVKNPVPAVEEEDLADLEGALEPEELESLEEEFTDDEALDGMDEEPFEEVATAETTEEAAEEELESARRGDGRRAVSAKADIDVEVDLEDEDMGSFDEDEYEEEEIPEVPTRRETRQELLGRLMVRLLDDREQVHQSLERVRDLNTQLRDAGPRPPEKLKEAYHKAIADLSRARREENFARAELMQVLSWRG